MIGLRWRIHRPGQFGMPAILKGWVDRTFARGFGVNGRLDEILWPIQHGVLFYPGMEVLPPFVVYQSDRLTDEGWLDVAGACKTRINSLSTDTPIPFRTQNGGHYDGQQVLKPGLGDGETGMRIHLVRPGDPKEALE